jgi:hypothetical protein
MFVVLFSSYQVSCLQEALWLSALCSPTPVVSAKRTRPLPKPDNADFTSRHSWQIVAALPSCTRDESQEMRVQTSAKGLESGHAGHQTHFSIAGHIFKAWALVEKAASV